MAAAGWREGTGDDLGLLGHSCVDRPYLANCLKCKNYTRSLDHFIAKLLITKNFVFGNLCAAFSYVPEGR